MSYTGVAAALADTGELAYAGIRMAGRCQATGLDPASYAGLAGAAAVLGGWCVLTAGPAWMSDRELVQSVAELQGAVTARLNRLVAVSGQAQATLHEARKMAAGKAWTDLPGWLRLLIVDCLRAIQIVDEAHGNIRYAATRLASVPAELGERYAAAYAVVAAGGVLPLNGRWLTGAGC